MFFCVGIVVLYVCLSVGLVLYVVVFLLCVLNSLLFDVRSLCLLEMIMLVWFS
jgi:hypothetical protein